MSYFKLNDIDFSMYVNRLKVVTTQNYESRISAKGNLIVKKRGNQKYVVEVGIIPLDATVVTSLLTEVHKLLVKISFLNPETNTIEDANCYIGEDSIEYYTINTSGTKLKAFTLVFTQL